MRRVRILRNRTLPRLREPWASDRRHAIYRMYAVRAAARGIRGPVCARIASDSTGDAMPFVKVRDNEPFDIALRRFKRSCEKAGILSEVRKREYYEKPTTVRKRKAAAAVKRHIKKLQREARRFEKAH